MRKVRHPQQQFGEVDIASIQLDPKSRDDIPHLLRGLQYIYVTPGLREAVFEILQEVLPDRVGQAGKASTELGRPGMEQWKILVLGVVRLGLNADYDRLQELANQHRTLRQMLGHSDWLETSRYQLQTLKDNLRLFTPELLDRINQEVVRAGHQLLKKNPEDGFSARCDSFVVETDVHFPTDINLLFDAVRKCIEECAQGSEVHGLPGWRQSAFNLRQFKKQYRQVQKLKHSSAKDEDKREARAGEIRAAHEVYLQQAEGYLERAQQTRGWLREHGGLAWAGRTDLDGYLEHAERQIDQIRRRVLNGEKIPHAQKVFSIFEPHTEWISKGKAGVRAELGLKVCILEDSMRFIVHHQVMQQQGDEQIAVALVSEAKARFPCLRVVSMDKGFHSPSNQTELRELLDQVVLPKKGRLSQTDQDRQSDPAFIRLRHQHSAVESAINALEAHGLDRCPDHGLVGFERYVALAVLARNIQRLGVVVRDQQTERGRGKRGPYKKAA